MALMLTREIGGDKNAIALPELGVLFTLVARRGGKVRVAVTAPKDVRILRTELTLKENGDGAEDC